MNVPPLPGLMGVPGGVQTEFLPSWDFVLHEAARPPIPVTIRLGDVRKLPVLLRSEIRILALRNSLPARARASSDASRESGGLDFGQGGDSAAVRGLAFEHTLEVCGFCPGLGVGTRDLGVGSSQSCLVVLVRFAAAVPYSDHGGCLGSLEIFLGLSDRAGSGSLGILPCLDVGLSVLVVIGIVEDVAVALGETVESMRTKVDRRGQSLVICGVGLLRLVFGSVEGI